MKMQSHTATLIENTVTCHYATFIQYDIHLFLASITLHASGIQDGMTASCAISDKCRMKSKKKRFHRQHI